MTISFPVSSFIGSRRAFGWLLMVLLLTFCLVGGSAMAAQGTEGSRVIAAPALQTMPHQAIASAEAKEEGLPQAAPVLFDTPYFKITSSMVVTWIVAVLLIFGAQMAMRRTKEIPDGAQNFWEWMVEGLYNLLEGIIGHKLVRQTFWFFASIFIFILATNWFGLLPGVGTIGWGHYTDHGFEVTKPLLRGANADLNMTFAMSMVFFACWIFWALRANGLFGFLLHLFGPKGETKGFMKLLMIVVFLCAGALEIVSILFRPVSLSFRLFGNIFAGENMLETMSHLGGPAFGWLLPIPFYFMEILVGIVQALVFMLLTAVFTLLIMPDEEGHH